MNKLKTLEEFLEYWKNKEYGFANYFDNYIVILTMSFLLEKIQKLEDKNEELLDQMRNLKYPSCGWDE